YFPYSPRQSAAIPDRRPVLVSAETRIKPGILPSGATTPIPGALVEPKPSLPAETALPPKSRRRGVRWGVALAASVGLLITGVAAIDAAVWVVGLFAHSGWLGVIGALLIGGAFTALVGFIGGEYRNLMRLRSAQAIREHGYQLAQSSNRFDGHGVMSDLVRPNPNSRTRPPPPP